MAIFSTLPPSLSLLPFCALEERESVWEREKKAFLGEKLRITVLVGLEMKLED